MNYLDDVEFKESISTQEKGEWNWVSSKQGSFEHPANYYESSLEQWKTFNRLDTEEECDVVVIGGGLLGASSALHLSESHVDTILLEKNRIGSGASGRNGGQLTPGLARWEAEEMIEHFGYQDAKRLWNFTSVEAMALIDDIASKYQVDLRKSRGHITAAIHEGHLCALTKGADARKYLGEDNTQIIGKHELQNHIASEIYSGALLDHLGGQIHPLALNRALAQGFVQNGGKIFEQSEVVSIEEKKDGIYVKTAHGVIKARKSVIIAVHHHAFNLLPERQQTAIPFYTYVAVTQPLEIPLTQLLPTQLAVYDTQIQIDYFRGVANNRLLFGGQGTGLSWNSSRVNHYLMGRINHVFPQLHPVEMDFCWAGISDLTMNGATDSRKFGSTYPIYAVHGWSGHGVAQTVRIGKAIADDLLKVNDDFDMLTQVFHKNIFLGSVLAPLAVPMAKGWYKTVGVFNPGKMVSF